MHYEDVLISFLANIREKMQNKNYKDNKKYLLTINRKYKSKALLTINFLLNHQTYLSIYLNTGKTILSLLSRNYVPVY